MAESLGGSPEDAVANHLTSQQRAEIEELMQVLCSLCALGFQYLCLGVLHTYMSLHPVLRVPLDARRGHQAIQSQCGFILGPLQECLAISPALSLLKSNAEFPV